MDLNPADTVNRHRSAVQIQDVILDVNLTNAPAHRDIFSDIRMVFRQKGGQGDHWPNTMLQLFANGLNGSVNFRTVFLAQNKSG